MATLHPSVLLRHSSSSPSPSFAPFRRSYESLRRAVPFPLPRSAPPSRGYYRRRSLLVLLSSSGESALTAAVTGSSDDDGAVAEENFIEVGYVSSTHGLRGELRVVSSTDFPELRFAKPGKRWLRTHAAGKESIKEVELTEGRGHPGQRSWIISFVGIDTVEEARQIVGSTLLVAEDDRPKLEEGDFYTHDLVGMRVFVKDTGESVGTVANIFNYGASDLLQVERESTKNAVHGLTSISLDTNSSCSHVWIPFVEAIVPDVDMEKREMRITPPKGLLELNVRSDVRSKKERRLMEWKQRRKLQQRLVAARKILSEMDQLHLLEGLRLGDKSQKASLSSQIANIDFRLFRQAMQAVSKPTKSLTDYMDAKLTILQKNALRVSHRIFNRYQSEEKDDLYYKLHEKGLELLEKSKAAIVLIRNKKYALKTGSKADDGRVESMAIWFQKLNHDFGELLKVEEDKPTVPFIVASPAHEIESFKECMAEHDFFGLNSQKVWVLEEGKLPIISASTIQSSNKILLQSPCEILQAPVGPGGVFSLLSSHKIIDALNEMGIEYVQVCSMDTTSAIGHPFFFGFVNSCGAEVGIKVSDRSKTDDNFDMIISMNHVNKIIKEASKLQFFALPEQHVHVELAGNEWIHVHSEMPNSYRLYCPIYGLSDNCSPDKVCALQIF